MFDSTLDRVTSVRTSSLHVVGEFVTRFFARPALVYVWKIPVFIEDIVAEAILIHQIAVCHASKRIWLAKVTERIASK